MEFLLASRSIRASFSATAAAGGTRGCSPLPSRVAVLGGARARPLRCGPKDSVLEELARDDMLNATELVQWENGMSINDIAASQGIRIRRHRRPTATLKEIEEELGAPRNILEKIIWDKEFEVAEGHAKKPLKEVIEAAKEAPPAGDFFGALAAAYKCNGVPALIAEVKKASPSRGVLRENFNPVEIAQAYEKNGAACLSILTDEKHFQGSFENLEKVRNSGVKCPLLCKEFVIDKWQIYYARSKGADAILLIAAVLPDLDIKYFLRICKELGMTALIEVHDEREMERVLKINGVQLIGINNRSLETFVVDTSNTKMLLQKHGDSIREKGILVVGESGLFTPDDVAYVQNAGVSAVLVGESLVKQEDPGRAIAGLFGKELVH
ncbi:indole-3-glycerol phosphate synthase, chloroplastic-like isoform X1 [Phragmites australis]|uniref:indole-3-glycerol phosphate synthase, chloroplastic-like isoform X1 n=1 Tax=Phragmites australis TaxID=29695 RepID=UPI002D773B0B|nr:indole-3-glycerol phosphate synthase, chloroplastic-like isoform X1 [Phragmites australis]